MAEELPAIEPTTFDLIVVGTSLPASITAAAASSTGKSVLHLDANPFYGSLFSSLSLPSLSSCLSLHLPPHLQHSRSFCVDVSGPRVLFCADSAIDLMIRTGISEYLEFKSIDASLIYDAEGNLWSVPDSRAAIFKDRSLGLTEKNQLMRFFKRVQEHLEARGEGERVISEEDLESSFVDFLTKMKLPKKIKSIILYAIAMADYDQENVVAGRVLLKTKDGIDRLALYHSSIGRFPNASGPMLYPMYGHGELPQAFCRRAAVKGCLYVLRMPVVSVLTDEENRLYKGIRLASGQELFSSQLAVDPNLPQGLGWSSPDGCSSQDPSPRNIKGKVARGICITKRSLKPDASNLLVVFPPRTLHPEQATSIRLLQISSNTAVCPSGIFVFYLSTLCNDADQGESMLRAAIDALFRPPSEGPETSSIESPEDSTPIQNEDTVEQKPTLLWSAVYVQRIVEGSCEAISSFPSPDGNLDYNDLIDATVKMFHKMYPGEELFPETAAAQNPDNRDDLEPDTFI